MEKQVALVVGGGSGIGKATAKHLIQLGYYVVIADQNEEMLRETFLEIQLGSLDVQMKAINIIEENEIVSLFDQWSVPSGTLDVIVNCAGVTNNKPLAETELSQWDLIMDVNLRGVYLICKHAFPLLKKSEGVVLNISSIMAVKVYPNNSPYSISKAGLNHLTKTLAAEWKGHNIRINAISPATVDTPLLRKGAKGSQEEIDLQIQEGIKANRIQTAEQIAGVIGLFVRPEARILNGVCIVADGGSQLY